MAIVYVFRVLVADKFEQRIGLVAQRGKPQTQTYPSRTNRASWLALTRVVATVVARRVTERGNVLHSNLASDSEGTSRLFPICSCPPICPYSCDFSWSRTHWTSPDGDAPLVVRLGEFAPNSNLIPL